MQQGLWQRISALCVLVLVVGLFLPAGAAHASVTLADYYVQWDKSAVLTPPWNTSTVVARTVTANAFVPTPTGTPVTTLSDRAAYYSLLRTNAFTFLTSRLTPDLEHNAPLPNNKVSEMRAVANPTPSSAQGVDLLTPAEAEMFRLVNEERVKAGLPPFSLDMRLVRLARLKSEDMYKSHYFGHVSPTYGTAYDMERKAGISARVMGAENIAKATTVARAHQLFMNSPLHRANILDPRHDAIGIGIVTTPYAIYVTELFIGD